MSNNAELLRKALRERIVIIDGAMGTTIRTYGLGEAEIRGERFKDSKKDLILKAVRQTGGNYTEAARLLGVHPNYLHRLIRNLNLKSALTKSTGS